MKFYGYFILLLIEITLNYVFVKCEFFDTNFPIIKSFDQNSNKLFGFSIDVIYEKSHIVSNILIGAPTDLDKSPSTTNRTGAVYYCPITDQSNDCKRISLPNTNNDALIGYSVACSNNTDGSTNQIFTCAPRVLKTYSSVNYVGGECFRIARQDLTKYTMESMKNNYCEDVIKKTISAKELRNCLLGACISTDLMGTDSQVLITAPYMFYGKGSVMRSSYNKEYNYWTHKNYDFEKLFGTYQLIGSSMSVGKSLTGASTKTVAFGGPSFAQTNMTMSTVGQGAVLISQFQTPDQLTFQNTIFGTTFGDGFGYSVLLIDLDGDGVDELVTGAPYDNNNQGAVLILWSNDVKIPPQKLIPPAVTTSSKNRQFGSALANLGDVDNDGLLDIGIGSPFDNDGSGSVFIYCGSKSRHLRLVQTISGMNLPSKPRGLGFSILRRSVDLDNNQYSDILVGAPLTNHVYGFRARPLIKLYSKEMLQENRASNSYDLSKLGSCVIEGGSRSMPCFHLIVEIYYHPAKMRQCSVRDKPMSVRWKLQIDALFMKHNKDPRVVTSESTQSVQGQMLVGCKLPNQNSSPGPRSNVTIYILRPEFFNFSQPIQLDLYYTEIKLDKVPQRPDNNPSSGKLSLDLTDYPTVNNTSGLLKSNQINIGTGCDPSSCKPIIQLDISTSLIKQGNEYILYIGNQSEFNFNVRIKNTAQDINSRAFSTYLRFSYSSVDIQEKSSLQKSFKKLPDGILYAVRSPLNPGQSEQTQFNFTLSKDFLQSGQKLIWFNISLETIYPQPHLNKCIYRIRMKMIANIDLKVYDRLETISYEQAQILGFGDIKREEKIGPKVQMTVKISNMEKASVIVSSKLVIFFPFEISGDVKETHGQFMLYLLRQPQFKIIGGSGTTSKRNITCDNASLSRLVNVLNTRLLQSSNAGEANWSPVHLDNVTLPKDLPKFHAMKSDLVFVNSLGAKSNWEKTVLINCRNGSARCVPIVCDLGTLSRQSGEINLLLEFRIWIYTLIENFLKYKYVHIDIPIYWIPDVNYDIVLNKTDGSFVDAKIAALNLQKPQLPPSITFFVAITIGVACGALCLAIIIVILYKCRFFQRKRLLRNSRTTK